MRKENITAYYNILIFPPVKDDYMIPFLKYRVHIVPVLNPSNAFSISSGNPHILTNDKIK